MTKHHPGRQFMLGAMLGSAIGAISTMMFTTKKGHAIQKNAMEKLHGFESHMKRLISRNKKKVVKTIKKIHRASKKRKNKI